MNKNTSKFTKITKYLDLVNKEGYTINNINNVNFICSLTLLKKEKTLNKSNNFYTDVLFSTKLVLDDLSVNNVLNKIKDNKDYIKNIRLHVIIVSLGLINSNIKRQGLVLDNSVRTKVVIDHYSYNGFMLDIEKILTSIDTEKTNYEVSPIFIFQGLHLSTLTHLFREHGFNFHGGSSSLRHKISSLERDLCIFLYITDIKSNNKKLFYYSFVDTYLSSNKLAPELFEYFKHNQKVLSPFDFFNYLEHPLLLSKGIQPVLYNFMLQSILLEIIACFNLLSNKKKTLVEDLSKLDSSLNSIDESRDRSKYIRQREHLTKIILILNTELAEQTVMSQLHKMNKRNKIKKLKEEIKHLDIEEQNKIHNNSTKVTERENKKLELETVEQDLKSVSDNKSKIKSLVSKIKINQITIDCNNYKSFQKNNKKGKREYSTYNSNSIKKMNFEIDSPIFIELQRILSNSSLNNETQIKIEQFLTNQGKILLQQRLDQNLDINYNKINPSVLEKLKTATLELDLLIVNHKKNLLLEKDKNQTFSFQVESLVLLYLSNEEISSQLLGRLLRIISNNNLLNKNTNAIELARDLSDSLLNSFYSQKFKEYKSNSKLEKEYGLGKYITNFYKEINEKANNTILVEIGLRLLNLLVEVKLIHTEIISLERKSKVTIFKASPKIIESLGSQMKLLTISYKIPMIVKPKKYSRSVVTGEILGGYLLNDIDFHTPLIIKNSELKEQSEIDENNIIFDLINNLSSVGYKINIPVLEFLLENNLEYGFFTEQDYVHPLEEKKKKGRKLTILENKILDSYLSKKQLEMNVLGLALIFKNVPEFYIPVRIDNRGRVYCMVDYLNYQSIELAKSLLLFSKGEIIYKSDTEAIEYLKIFGANCFGNGIDKKSFNERVN